MWRRITAGDDALSDIQFGPSDILACSSWDNNVYLMNSKTCQPTAKFGLRAPALSIDWGGAGGGGGGGGGSTATHLYCGGAEQHVSVFDLKSSRLWDVGGDHRAAISAVRYIDSNVVISGGFDGQLQIADTRDDKGIFYQLPGKVLSMDSNNGKLVVGMTGKLLNVYDVRRLSEPLIAKKMQFKDPIRSVVMFKDGNSYSCSSVKGRVAVEFLQSPRNDFTFRAHQTQQHSFMINALCVDPNDPQLLTTGGSDCIAQVWNYKSKSRVHQFPKLPLAINKLSYSHDGKLLAAAIYDDTYQRIPAACTQKIPSSLMLISV